MGRMTLPLPRLGETMEEARVTAWLVTEGQAYRRGDVLMEVETDKTVVEVPAMADGTLIAQLVAEGEMVALEQPFAEVEQAGEAVAPKAETAAPAAVAPAAAVPVAPVPAGGRASPKARAAARRSGIDLAQIGGTGRNGRVTADDVAAQQGGGGASVVLLHGLFDNAKGWRDLPRRLERQGRAVHAPDLPGHGAHPQAAMGFDDLVAHLLAELPAGPLVLIGHSLGGALAVRLATQLGARVRRVILIAPAGIGARINADFLDGMLAAETPAALARALALLDVGPMGASLVAEELARIAARRDGLAVLARSMAHLGLQQIDLRDDIARLACPVSVVFGTADRILDWQAVADLPPQVAVHLVKGAGHLPHVVAPSLVPDLLAATSDYAQGKEAL